MLCQPPFRPFQPRMTVGSHSHDQALVTVELANTTFAPASPTLVEAAAAPFRLTEWAAGICSSSCASPCGRLLASRTKDGYCGFKPAPRPAMAEFGLHDVTGHQRRLSGSWTS